MFNTYLIRFAIRIILLFVGFLVYFTDPGILDVENFEFFSSFSPTHIIWVYLLVVILFAFFPKARVNIGSLKYRKKYYSPTDYNADKLVAFKRKTNRSALLIAALWLVFNIPFWILYYLKIITSKELLFLVMIFAAADIFCVLFFCPFQLVLNTKCCTTCRIFLWDHLMMVTPLMVVPGFFARSLVVLAALLLLVWEMSWRLHPEYFWENSNKSLRCSACHDKICQIKKPISTQK